jgi:tetratricopeptide (TPR) repeat protein
MMREQTKERPGRWRRGAVTLAGAAALAALLATPTLAAIPATPTQAILSRAVSAASLRAQLDSLANAEAAHNPNSAGEARYYQGESFSRAGLLDSAIAAYQSALSLRNSREELLALTDARLLREAPGDAAAVLRELAPAIAEAGSETAYTLVWLERRMAWAHFLAGHADSAAAMFQAAEDMPGLRWEWRYRMALPTLATGDARKAYDLLFPVAVASRKQDPDVMQQLEAAAAKLGERVPPGARVDAEIHGRDARAQRLFESWGGRRVLFPGTDGFRLTGIVVPAGGATSPARAPGAVVLMAPSDTLAAYDSLVIALRGHGVSTILVPARGTDWSVSPACPLPDAWEGREEKLERQCALDVRPALRQLAATTPVDTTRILVVGTTSTCVSAAQAARLDRSVRALLLVSPLIPAVDRGPMCADLGASRVPAFFQIAPEDFDFSYEVTDLLYQAGNHAASRVVEGTQAGHGVAQLRSDSTLLPRFLLWLDDALKSRPPARATPPAARRKG